MKLKYYLRGLGIGILVSVIIVAISSGNQKMTDEEIIARAKELGMVENMVLSGMNNQEVDQEENVVQPEETETKETEPVETQPEEILPEETKPEETIPEETQPEETEPIETEPIETEPIETEPIETEPIETEPEPEQSEEPEIEEKPPVEENSTITITIKSGESSVSVSKTLEAAGLVESASVYDRFLCENGYDRRIRVGTYEIPLNATEDEIAKIITGQAN